MSASSVPRALFFVLFFAFAIAGLAGCSRDAAAPAAHPAGAEPVTASFYGTPFERHPDAAELTSLGRSLFSEPALSRSGALSCASCHSPAHAYGPPNDLSVQLGGADLERFGVRAVPSLMYAQDTPPFSEHFNDTDGDDSVDQGPTGGRDWDGRASSAHEQASGPLLSPFEMGNADAAQVIARLQQAPTADAFRTAFGPRVFDDPKIAWNGLLLALEVFQQSPADFYPYSSKYDAFLRGKARLSAAERRGLALFNDAGKANCLQCHSGAVKRGAFPQFTDRGFIAIGVPRNASIPANADPAYFDLGLCGPLRADLEDHPEYCGLFKTPTLRNVARRGAFFHNGVFHRLEDVVRFYAERDVHPGKFYPRGKDHAVQKFDDLPGQYRGNLNDEAPFDRKPGDTPVLTEAQIRDLVSFLGTLDDGYRAEP
ncbi:cytochrome c peroxidase [soil metagenome]